MTLFRLFALASAIFAPSLAAGQTLETLVPRLPEPARGELSAETSLSSLLNPVYNDAGAHGNELAHSLDLSRVEVRLSYGLSPSFAAGVLGAYGFNRYCCLNGAGLSDSGFTGGGLFLDWSPGKPGGGRDVVRIGFEIRRGPDNTLLPVSDGQDRLFLRSDWSIFTAGHDRARLGLRVDLDYGRPFEIQKAYLRGDSELALQAALARAVSWELDVSGTAGYVVATDARENGTIFHNRRSSRFRGGAELNLGLGRRRRDEVALEAKHDFAARNALSGWRVGLTYRRRFGKGRR